MEDFIGDESEGCVTMPIKRGLKFAARYTLALSVLVVIPLLIAAIVLYQSSYIILSAYVLVLLVVPLLAWAIFLNRDFTTIHYASKQVAEDNYVIGCIFAGSLSFSTELI